MLTKTALISGLIFILPLAQELLRWLLVAKLQNILGLAFSSPLLLTMESLYRNVVRLSSGIVVVCVLAGAVLRKYNGGMAWVRGRSG